VQVKPIPGEVGALQNRIKADLDSAGSATSLDFLARRDAQGNSRRRQPLSATWLTKYAATE
jgi:hypothetical protein